MPKIQPVEIYQAARQAGFSPDQAVTMTAIALAESGGKTDARYKPDSGEDSIGLWQINTVAHRDYSIADLENPVFNARAAWEVSNGGKDIGRWTTAHASKGARYLAFREQAEAAATAAGEAGARGNWNPPEGYRSPKVGAGPGGEGRDFGVFDDFEASSQGGGGPSVGDFLNEAMKQAGDAYIFGAETDLNDSDPDAFDCSELVQWAAARAGLPDVPDGSFNQYLWMKQQGMLIPVEEAANIPGAILFSFSTEPVPGGGRPSSAHVAISLGDGNTIEARGTKYGVDTFPIGNRCGYAAIMPGLDYGNSDITSAVIEFDVELDSDGDLVWDSVEAWLNGESLGVPSPDGPGGDRFEALRNRVDYSPRYRAPQEPAPPPAEEEAESETEDLDPLDDIDGDVVSPPSGEPDPDAEGGPNDDSPDVGQPDRGTLDEGLDQKEANPDLAEALNIASTSSDPGSASADPAWMPDGARDQLSDIAGASNDLPGQGDIEQELLGDRPVDDLFD